MGREFELKYAATPEKLAALRENWENWDKTSMETTYFDTADGVLSAQKCTLRRRMENGVSVCTMKTPSAGFGRGEWDASAPWCPETVQELFSAAGKEPIAFEELTAVCGARFTRLSKMVELPGCVVEIALDQGVLVGGDRQIPLCEMEVEYKSGSEEAMTIWAKRLAQRYGLTAEHESKFKRASALAKGE